MKRAKTESFPADAAEARSPAPCAICGRLTVTVAAKDRHPTCCVEHARIAAEAQEGTSRSTVLLGEAGSTLALRAFARIGPGRVRFVSCEATALGAATVVGDLQPHDARRLAGALLRAADRAEGRRREVAQA